MLGAVFNLLQLLLIRQYSIDRVLESNSSLHDVVVNSKKKNFPFRLGNVRN